MARKTWTVQTESGFHTIELEHNTKSGKRSIIVDGELEDQSSHLPDMGSEHPLELDRHRCVVQVQPNGVTFNYSLICDGRLISDSQQESPTVLSEPWGQEPAPDEEDGFGDEMRKDDPNAEARARYEFERLQTQSQARSGANWFYWIAAFSIINTLTFLFGTNWGFAIGLGVTILIDVLAFSLTAESGDVVTYIALALDVCIAGLVALLGWLAGKGHNWAFIVGMVFYTLDGLLLLLFQDWLSVGIHLFALFFIFKGLQANMQLQEYRTLTRI